MRKTKEINIQHEILIWFNQNYTPNNAIIFPVPNEGTYNKSNMTVLKGVSDLVVAFPDKVVFVEVKNKNNQQTKPQRVFQARCNALGYEYQIVRSLEEFQTKVCRL